MKKFLFGIGCLLIVQLASAQPYLASTIAGIGIAPGYSGDSGPANLAQLANPIAVVVDSQGNAFIADYNNYVIRRVDGRTGVISTYAGNNSIGYSGDGGPATNAQISIVHGLAVDTRGNLYIADTANAVVRMVDTNGNISTIAGNGTRGYSGDGGPAINAQMFLPAGLAIDTTGNLYIADYGNGTVRKVNPSGSISTAAGIDFTGYGLFPGDGGFATQATLGLPYSIAVDESGNLYVGDVGSSSIRKVAKNGVITTIVSQASVGGLATDPAGDLFYSDYRQNIVVEVYPNGATATVAGLNGGGYSGDAGPGTYAQLNQPYGLASDSSGNIYVAEYLNTTIRKLSVVPSSTVLVTNGASNIVGPIAPGEIVSLFGRQIGFAGAFAEAQPDANGLIERQFGPTMVTFNGIPAPIVITSPSQVSVIVPYELAGATQANIVIASQGQTTGTTTASVVASSPGIFTANSSANSGAGFTGGPILNSDGRVNNRSNAAAESSTITLFITGEGLTTAPSTDGLIATGPDFTTPQLPVAVYINGENAAVSYVGGAAGEVAGVTEIQVAIPSDVTTSSLVPITVQVGNSSSQTTYFAVQ